jgi:DHA2 family multidrug resistance protein
MLSGLGHQMSGVLGSNGDLAAVKQLYGLMTREATVMAFADCFFVLAICFLAMLLTLPTVDKPKAMVSAKDAH